MGFGSDPIPNAAREPSRDPSWRQTPAPPPRSNRWKRLLIAAIGLGLCVSAGTWLVLWLRPPPAAKLIVITAGYDESPAIPSNATGRAAASRLASWFGSPEAPNGRGDLRSAPTPLTLKRGGVDAWFEGIPRNSRQSLLLFITAHGGTDEEGPFLIPDGATADPLDRVRFSAILKKLAELPAKANKLLIVDATQAPAMTRIGLCRNTFAEGLELLDAEIAAVPNLIVLSANRAEEQSWIAPEWGESAFSHYVIRGLQGDADGNRDRRLNADELVRYVGDRVARWTRDNRGEPQHPELFPTGQTGQTRAAAMHLSLLNGPTVPDDAPKPFVTPPSLTESWTAHLATLQSEVPPTAYVPHLWRELELWQMRHEEIVRNGLTTEANPARANAATLRQRIAASNAIPTGPYSLPLLQSLGNPATTASTKIEAIQRLANVADAERPALWEKIKDDKRMEWGRSLLDWIAGDPTVRLAKAASLVPLVCEGLTIRPAELHFLFMLGRDHPNTPQAAAFWREAIQVRLLAEEAALGFSDSKFPFSEQIQPWIIAKIIAADHLRRRGEDLLFSSQDESWKSGEKHLKDALTIYRDQLAIARQVRTALHQWHATAAKLQGLSEWMSVRARPSDVAGRLKHERELQDFLQLWAAGDALGDRLQNKEDVELIVRLTAVVAQAKDFEAAADRIVLSVLQELNQLLAEKPPSEQTPQTRTQAIEWWHRADRVLTVPPMSVEHQQKRSQLVLEHRRVSRQLLVLHQTQPGTLPETSQPVVRETLAERTRARGLLELARIRIGDERAVQLQFDQANRDSYPLLSLHRAERELNRLGRELTASIAALKNQSDDAERNLRRCDGSTNEQIAVNPCLIRRRAQTAELLIEEATRRYEDHWYTETGEPYFRIACRGLMKQVEPLLGPAGEVRVKEITEFLLRETPYPLKVISVESQTLTDQTFTVIQFEPKPVETGKRSGYIVYRVDPPFGIMLKTDERESVRDAEFGGPTIMPVFRLPTEKLDVPTRVASTCELVGYFRGRADIRNVAIERHPVADAIAMPAPVPKYAGIAVRTDDNLRNLYGRAKGSISVVVDCSGSMAYDEDNPTRPAKYDDALALLEKFLSQIPKGTTLNFWAFGQFLDSAKVPEDAIEEIQQPFVWEGLDSKAGAEILLKYRALRPWGKSPIVRSLLMARDKLRLAGEGEKSIVLFSDGADTAFAEDPKLGKAGKVIPDVLRAAFTDGGIRVHVVAFPVDASQVELQNQFRLVEEIRPTGRFVTPEKLDVLIADLRNALKPLLQYTVETDGLKGTATMGISGADLWLNQPLKPDTYTLKSTDFQLEQPLPLKAGDRLLLGISAQPEGLSLSRVFSVAESPALARNSKDSPDWQMAVVQSLASESQTARLLTMLEDRPGRLNLLEPTRIRDFWLEVRNPVPNQPPFANRWIREFGDAAPTWAIDLKGWGSASPVVEAWWLPDAIFTAAVSNLEGKPQTVTVGKETVVIESADVEEGAYVVRIRHPIDSPYIVRLHDQPLSGGEIRIYKAANQTVCRWPESDKPHPRIDLMSLNAIKADAVKAKTSLKLVDVPAPMPGSPRPPLPLPVK